MKRRDVIKGIALLFGAAAVPLPMAMATESVAVNTWPATLSEAHKPAIDALGDMMIPGNAELPSFSTLDLSLSVAGMLAHCLPEADLVRVRRGLSYFNADHLPRYEHELTTLTRQGKVDLSRAPTIPFMLYHMRQFAILAYVTSEYYQTQQLMTQVVPGRYQPFKQS